MFLYHILEELCAYIDGYFCLKTESILHSDWQYYLIARWIGFSAREGPFIPCSSYICIPFYPNEKWWNICWCVCGLASLLFACMGLMCLQTIGVYPGASDMRISCSILFCESSPHGCWLSWLPHWVQSQKSSLVLGVQPALFKVPWILIVFS